MTELEVYGTQSEHTSGSSRPTTKIPMSAAAATLCEIIDACSSITITISM